ncbi:MAG TPA: hypothetical protein VGN57_12750 [Pirellulaceae bacterium]|jgi:hypothetical protein|nr:hypothetical protein [Pirellulaceae bacterium]
MTVYHFHLRDNESYAFRAAPKLTEFQKVYQEILPDFSGEALPAKRCDACGELLDKWNESLAGLKVRKRRYDASYTYDGLLIVSARFKEVYDASHLRGLRFRGLPDDPAFFDAQATRRVEYDSIRRQTRFIKPCSACRRFESVVGATPVFLAPHVTVAPDEFVHTDVEFASKDEKGPLLLCGETVTAVLKREKLKGICLEAI